MKLIELNNIADDFDLDTSDSVYDIVIHIYLSKDMFDTTEEPNRHLFLKTLYEHIEIEKVFNGAFATLICKWSDLFTKNKELWVKYTDKHWDDSYASLKDTDESEYFFQLVDELSNFIQGYRNESQYEQVAKIIKECK